MRRYVLDTVFQMHTLVRGHLLGDADPSPPLGRGPDRPRHKTAAAVRAYIVKFGLNAVRAERAFITAYPSLRRIRRQVLVAIFAVWLKLQRHVGLIKLNFATLESTYSVPPLPSGEVASIL